LSLQNNIRPYKAIRFEEGVASQLEFDLIGEEPLMIRVDDNPYSVVMRTPGEEIFHATGLCLGEGLIDSVQDLAKIGYDSDIDPNLIDIWLTPERRQLIPNLLKRKTYISQTSCGICGKKMIEDMHQAITPLEDGFTMKMELVFKCMKRLSDNQAVYPKTRGSHAALILDEKGELMSFSEDVGRHNALDKAIGKVFMDESLNMAKILVLSSRISYELVQKTARARLPVIISKSRPTALAANMGNSLNITMTCAFGPGNLILFSGSKRIETTDRHDA
jgi:FdhD protein